ncbi:hypothetical protein Tco_0034347 [Tanacetum coccineum]
MASLDRRLNPLYAIKECSSCGNLHTKDCGCPKGSLEDKILVPIPDLSQRPLKIEKICLDCGDPVHGLYCRQCALIRKTLEEVFQDFQDTSKSSNDDTNFVNQEPFVVKQGPGVNSSQSPPQINHNCCYECGDSLDDIFCQRCTSLEASIERDNRDEFLSEKDKSRKRHQDPHPPPTKEFEQSKKKKQDSDASGSKQTPAQTSSAWQTSATRNAPSSSSQQKNAPQSEQPVDDNQIPDVEHISDSEDTGVAHLPKIKTRPNWLNPVPEEDRPETLELDWVIPPNDLPEPENNWANAFATSYKDPEENKLLQKTGDMGSFIKCISLQYQMEECHLLLTDQIDLVNPEGHRVVPNMSKPLPLGGSKEIRSALSISKLKATNYPDFGLEELVPSLWIKSEREYDVSATFGISHWWFKHKEFYITKHSAPSNRRAVRADYNEYMILESNFKNLNPNDIEDMYMLYLQGKLNHLSGSDKVNLFNAVNL